MSVPAPRSEGWRAAWAALGLGPAPHLPSAPTAMTLWARGERAPAREAVREMLADRNVDVSRLKSAAALLTGWGELAEAASVMRRIADVEAESLGLDVDRREDTVAFKLAAAGIAPPPQRAPEAYVEALFDRYAAKYDAHLVETLHYRGPEIFAEALARVLGAGAATLDVLDAGCGTGLLAPCLRAHARRLDGIDRSSGMIEVARAKGRYDRLDVGDLIAALAGRPAQYDLVAAADVLMYFGALDGVFDAAATALRGGGHFAFSVETSRASEVELRRTSRFAHSRDYVHAAAARCGMSAALDESVTVRTELGAPVAARIFVMKRAGAYTR